MKNRIMILFLGCFLCGCSFYGESTEAPGTPQHEITEEVEESPTSPVIVDVIGEVYEPGIQSLPQGSRVADAVKAAGGATEAAKTDALNMARILKDGEQICVPDKHAVPSVATDERININTASARELETVRGIGPARAADIIRYRETHGPFTDLAEIKNISGIKDAFYEKVKDDLRVE